MLLVRIPFLCPGSQRRRHRGWTLIELMMVLAIVAILLAIAYPAYTEQVRKSKRADAINGLMAGAQVLERCFTRQNTYVGCPDVTGLTADGHYAIAFAAGPAATTYTLSATPQGDQANDACGTYTLDHLGNKTPTPDGNRCWGS